MGIGPLFEKPESVKINEQINSDKHVPKKPNFKTTPFHIQLIEKPKQQSFNWYSGKTDGKSRGHSGQKDPYNLPPHKLLRKKHSFNYQKTGRLSRRNSHSGEKLGFESKLSNQNNIPSSKLIKY